MMLSTLRRFNLKFDCSREEERTRGARLLTRAMSQIFRENDRGRSSRHLQRAFTLFITTMWPINRGSDSAGGRNCGAADAAKSASCVTKVKTGANGLTFDLFGRALPGAAQRVPSIDSSLIRRTVYIVKFSSSLLSCEIRVGERT